MLCRTQRDVDILLFRKRQREMDRYIYREKEIDRERETDRQCDLHSQYLSLIDIHSS
jgi:hypothetical protein